MLRQTISKQAVVWGNITQSWSKHPHSSIHIGSNEPSPTIWKNLTQPPFTLNYGRICAELIFKKSFISPKEKIKNIQEYIPYYVDVMFVVYQYRKVWMEEVFKINFLVYIAKRFLSSDILTPFSISTRRKKESVGGTNKFFFLWSPK